MQPSFGLREFPAYFELVPEDAGPAVPIPWDADLGWMLYDVFDLSRPGACCSAPGVSLFRAVIAGGRMTVPPYSSPEVRKLEGTPL
jgi:CRISPR-associated protein Cas5d